MYYRRNRRYNTNLKVYAICCNNQIIGTSMGKNSRSALMEFCRINRIPFGNGMAYGECGIPIRTCAENYYGARPCGSGSRCVATYAVPSSMGLLIAKIL